MSVSDQQPVFALKTFLDMEITDEAEAVITVSPEHLNPNGVVHGGVLFTMADTAMGKASMGVLDEEHYCASVEVQLRFIRPVSQGRVVAKASVVKKGRSIIHLEAKIFQDEDRLIATATGTFTVISFEPPGL